MDEHQLTPCADLRPGAPHSQACLQNPQRRDGLCHPLTPAPRYHDQDNLSSVSGYPFGDIRCVNLGSCDGRPSRQSSARHAGPARIHTYMSPHCVSPCQPAEPSRTISVYRYTTNVVEGIHGCSQHLKSLCDGAELFVHCWPWPASTMMIVPSCMVSHHSMPWCSSPLETSDLNELLSEVLVPSFTLGTQNLYRTSSIEGVDEGDLL